MKERCKNCKWRGEKTDWFLEDYPVDVRFCEHPMVHVPREFDGRVVREDGIYTIAEGGCTDKLCVAPDFGCLHFSPAVGQPLDEYRCTTCGGLSHHNGDCKSCKAEADGFYGMENN